MEGDTYRCAITWTLYVILSGFSSSQDLPREGLGGVEEEGATRGNDGRDANGKREEKSKVGHVTRQDRPEGKVKNRSSAASHTSYFWIDGFAGGCGVAASHNVETTIDWTPALWVHFGWRIA